MSLKKHLLAFWLLTLSFIAFGEDCYTNYLKGKKYGEILFPKSQTCISLNTKQSFLTPKTNVTVERGYYEVYANRPDNGNEDVLGCELKETLYFYVTVLPDGKEEGPFVYQFPDDDGLFYKYSDSMEKNDNTWTFNKKSKTITYDGLDRSYSSGNHGKQLSYIRAAAINIRLQMGAWINVKRGTNANRVDRQLSIEGKPVNIKYYNCDPGEIGAYTTLTPKIVKTDEETGFEAVTYCVYPTSTKNNLSSTAVQLTNVQSPGEYGTDLYFSWNLHRYNGYGFSDTLVSGQKRLVRHPDNNGQSLGSFVSFSYYSIKDFEVGEKFKIFRTISLTNRYENELDCSTPSLTFEIVPEAFLSDKGVTSVKVCPKSGEMTYDGKLYYKTDAAEWLYLKGEDVKFRDNDNVIVPVSDEMYKAYGVKYGWEYSTDNVNWISLMDKEIERKKPIYPCGDYNYIYSFLSDNPFESQDLLVPNNMFADGKTRYFRQVVTLTNFQNRKIVSEKLHEVKPYYIIEKNDFEVTPLGTICADGTSQEVELSVNFKRAPSSEAMNGYKWVSDNGGAFQYDCLFLEQKDEIKGVNLSTTYNVFADEANKYDAKITVTDGCGTKIELQETLTIEEQPKIDPTKVICTNATYEYNELQNQVEVTIPEGVVGYLIVDKSDENYSTSKYEYSTQGIVYGKLSSRGTDVLLTTQSEKKYYLRKTNIRGIQCESEPLTVIVKKVGAIVGNKINEDTIYVCKNSENPLITAESVYGGFGDGAALTYSWIYSFDDKTYTSMLDASDKVLTDTKVDAGAWGNHTIDKKVYIRRIVTSKKGTGVMSDTSDAVVVIPYSDPVVSLAVDTNYICYGEKVTLNGSVDANFQKQLDKTNTDVNYIYMGGKQTLNSTPSLAPYSITITKDTIVSMNVEFCGKTVSSKGVTVSSGNNLKPRMANGACRVRGKKMKVSVNGVNADYTYKINGEEGTSAEVNIPKSGGFTYDVTVSDSKCEKTFTEEVKDGDLKDSLRHFELAVNGAKLSEGQMTCAGTSLTIANIDQEKIDNIANNYTWYLDGKSQAYSNSDAKSFNLPTPGKTYTIMRKSEEIEGGETCQSILDSISVTTYDNISGATLTANKETVCYDEGVSLSISGMKGAGEREYKYTIYDGTKPLVSNTVEYGTVGEEYIDKFETAGIHNLYAVLRDTSVCNNNSTYSQNTLKIQLYQAETAEFTLTASPSVIEEGAGLTKVVINTTANNGGSVIADDFTYQYMSEKGKIKEEGPANFSIAVNGTDFSAIGTLRIDVERTVAETGCKASNSVTITQTAGFEDQPSILCDAAVDDDKAEICGNKSATLSISALPAYGSKVLTSEDVTYTWYRNGVMVDGKSATYLATAKAGDTSLYQCKISYLYDKSLKPAYIFSNEFKLIGKKGVVLGNVYQQSDRSKNLAVCVGSDNEIALEVDAEYDPLKDEISWWESTDGKTWSAVPATNIKEQVDNTLVLDGSYYTEKSGKYYFRVDGKSDCGTFTNSRLFTLEVQDNPDTPAVALRSSNVINGSVASLNFSPKNNYAGYRYEWGVSEDDMPFFSTGGAQAVVSGDFAVGENKVYVRKVSTTGGHCASAVASYDFKLYEELTIGELIATSSATVRCPNNDKLTLQVSEVNGGSGAYAITWQYKSEGGNWIPFSSTSTLPFNFSIEDPVKLAGGTIFQLLLEGLSTTTTFRALVSSTGDYKGAVKYSNEYKVEYYEPLKDEGIDISEEEICYGSTIDGIVGKSTTGGNVSSPYQYQWYKTADREAGVWEAIPSATMQNYTKRDTLFETTFYKRVVVDGCGSKLESVSKRVGVNDKVEIKPEDIRYNTIVSNGNEATMWGMPNGVADASQYVWYDENWQTLDTTKTSEVYKTKKSLTVPGVNQHSKVYVYYAKKYLGGCLSYNSDTLFVTVSKNTSGNIFVNAENEDNFWVCSGTKDIEILSESNPLNAKEYSWLYRITEYNADDEPVTGSWDNVGGTIESLATGENINLDTCGLNRDALKNAKGRRKYIELKRLATFVVAGEEVTMESNVVRINIVPTMESIPLTRELITGTISSKRVNYCKGDIGETVSGDDEPSSVVVEIWRNPNNYFGPGLYDAGYKGGVYTWFEYSVDGINYDTVSMFNSIVDKKYASTFNPGEGMERVMNQSYRVRRGVSDGCSSVYTNDLVLTVSDEVADLSSISMYAYEPGKSGVSDRIMKGFEFGDSIVIGDKTMESYVCKWSLDSLFADTFATQKMFVGFTLDDNAAVSLMDDPNIYLKRKSYPYGECWSSSLQIPIALGTASKGGLISETQKVCFGADFKGINNIEEASGEWIAPKHAEMKWSYGWQWSQDSVKWVKIEDSNSISLSAELVNKYVDPLKLMSGKTTYFRRMATNDSARVRYSNVAVLSYYEEMKPGVLSDDQNGKTGYCAGDDLPVISTTLPTGGTFEENGVSYTWKLSIDGGEYVELPTKKTTLDLAFVDTIYNQTLDKNVEVSVVCEYSDGKIGCGTVESEPLNYVLYRRNDAPGIYQDNDSCDAQEVKVKVVAEKVGKSYIFGTFVNTENGDSLTWESKVNEITIQRVSSMIVDEYGVYSVDNETGCKSEYTKFNVDSLPDLRQSDLEAPAAVCYGEDYTIKGGTVIGGNGEKTFTWQYSSDGVVWDMLSNQTEDLDISKPKWSEYYRRIVSDMCGVDTSNAVYVEVREKIDVTKDALVFNDFKCANQRFNINTADDVVFSNNDYYLVWNSATNEEFDTKSSRYNTIDPFDGDSLEMRMTHAVVDTTGMICKSEEIVVYAHHSIALDPEANHISCENITPCNGRYVEIEGESQGGAHADKISYKWYVSKDKQTWMEDFKTGKDLSLLAEDTMFIRRIASNGCEADTSNIVTIFGTKVEQYDYVGKMMLNIVSDMQDSSVFMTIERGKEFAAGYFFEGDGKMPVVSSNTTVLPYKAESYKDSVLMLVAISDHCVSSYRFNPLRGGVISFDGDSILCGGSDIPAIVATLVEGGNGNYTYQWQYKNVYTADYVNIDGATGKEYTPKPVSVETSYRRKTMDGEYTSWSNVIKVNIRPLPRTTDIVPSVSDSVLKSYSLKKTQYSVEKLPSLELNLIDTISDADIVTWQKSYDRINWEDLESQEANERGVYTMAVVDTIETVYYRTVATSTCGEHTSKAYKVSTLYASVILDEELVLYDSVCVGGNMSIKYKKDYPEVYEYSYKMINFEGEGVHPYVSGSFFDSKVNLTDSTRVSYGVLIIKPKHSFDIEITRWVKKTGARSTKLVHFYVNDLSAKYNYIVDGVESHESGEKKNSVRLNQGSRVVFTPEITGGLESKTYKWNLIAPLNVEYYQRYGGNVGRDGLTSEKESPVCYFYNGGSYTITMQVTDGMCSATVSDTAMYISAATRGYLRSASFEDEIYDFVELPSVEFGFVDVTPTHFSDLFTIFTDLKSVQHYEVINSLGMKVKEGDYKGSVVVETSDLIPGAYIVNTAGNVIKIVKSK